ncbi:hypothetical protein [Aurantimonas sp. VKM B-3413]|uniref:hypothetical protein n=1 Tax=Aurantimonas sp. VKM B-3413 TaxID=2779401 RepID=UPI001E365EDD|nr:hypothetical protein [Aurantimonas sp. VKM B-3413]MCB8838122.1 hypothetical protein [Aurantimonas sp. VKM B-3413]
MIKLIGIGLWVCAVALGSSYLVATLVSPAAEAGAKPKDPDYFQGLDYKSTETVTIPMISREKLQGYILARFVYTIDGKTAAELQVPPDPFILDEVFRRLYSTDDFDFDRPERYDLNSLTDSIKEEINKRYGQKLIHEVLVEQFDYVPKNEARGGNGKDASKS